MIKNFLLFLIVAGLFSCSSRIAQNTIVPVTLLHPKNHQILFLSLEASRINNSFDFSLLDKRLVDGKLKRSMPSSLGLEQHLIFEFRSADGEAVTTVANENPLNKSVEVSNESGYFQRQQIKPDKATMVLRIQFNKQITDLRISDTGGNELAVLSLTL